MLAFSCWVTEESLIKEQKGFRVWGKPQGVVIVPGASPLGDHLCVKVEQEGVRRHQNLERMMSTLWGPQEELSSLKTHFLLMPPIG